MRKSDFTHPEIDALLVSPAMMENPYPIYRRLREEAPALWSEQWQAWVFSRHGDVHASLIDKDHLSNKARQALLFSAFTPEQLERTEFLRTFFQQQDIINSDPPDHTRMRKPVQRALMPKVVAGMEDKARRLAGELWRAATSRRRFDFVEAFAYPFPVSLVAELLGAAPEDRHRFKDWTADFLAFQGTGRADFARTMRSQESLLHFVGYVEALVEARRREPREDLVSALLEADYRDRELVATCCTLLVAGHETTTNLLGNIVRLLALHPGAWEELRAHREFVPAAIEECLRYDAPKQRNFRRALVDHTFAGAPIAANEMVFQLIGSANHDERAFPDPEAFDLHRRENPHLTFGAGIHFCVGAVLARLEARVFLEYFLEAGGDLRVHLDGNDFAWQQRVQMRGPGRMVLEVG